MDGTNAKLALKRLGPAGKAGSAAWHAGMQTLPSPPPHLEPEAARRIIAQLRDLAAQPLVTGHCSREDLNAEIYRPLGYSAYSRPSCWQLVADAIAAPTWHYLTTGEIPAGTWPEETWEALLPIVTTRVLDVPRAEAVLSEGLRPAFARYFFDGPVDALNVRNMALYMGVLLERGRDGGREQNLIPVQLSQRFGISLRSVPEAIALLDVLALSYGGAIRSGGADPCRIDGLFDAPVWGDRERFWAPAMEPHRRRALVGPNLDLAALPGTYDSSLLFNTARAAGLVEAKAARFEAFQPYYAALDPDAVWALYERDWAAISPANARRCAALREQARGEPAIRLRDLGNIVTWRSVHGPLAPLPSVAKFALGMPEPRNTGTGVHGFQRKMAQAEIAAPFRPLEELIESLDHASDSHLRP